FVTELAATDFIYAGGAVNSSSAATALWWTTSTKSAGTVADSTYANITNADNLFFGASAPMAGSAVWSSSINLGSSNQAPLKLEFSSGAPAYTIFASSSKKLSTGGSATGANQTNPQIVNNSTSAITIGVILTPSVGASSTSAAIFKQATSNGSLIFNGASASTTSYILNPYAYDWALSTGSTAAQAKTFAASSTAQQAIAAGTSTSQRFINLDGQGTITVGAAIGDSWRGNGGSANTAYSVSGSGNVIISNTGTTNLNGWNTYTGATTIGSTTASGGTVVIGNAYAFGGNRLAERTDPYNLVNTAPGGTSYTVTSGTTSTNYTLNAYMVGGTSAYSAVGSAAGQAGGAGTVASGLSNTTQAFGVVTVNNGFSVDLNGTTMIGANAMTIN
ncbi:hypothetical protein EBZ97_04995, partial [bacterium]|nr:hypothetical protein [bacterium]